MDWGSLETSLNPEPMFFVEGPDRDEATELERQALFVAKCRRSFPALKVIAIPNGAQRGQKSLNQARREGAAWGFPDLMVLGNGRAAFLEFKNGRAKPKAHQVEWLNRLTAMGFPSGLFRRPETALAFLAEHGFAEVRDAA